MALTQTQVSQLYVAIFNRASEGSGNAYWQTQGDMAAVATAMLATPDAQTYFGDSLDSDQAFIEHIYLNTLNKTAEDDADGIAFWVGQLEAGATRGAVVAALVEAIESYGPDGENYDPEDAATVAAYTQFTNRVEVSNYMADNVTNPPANYAQSTAFDKDLVVTDDAATVTSAKASVDELAKEDPVDPGEDGETYFLTADQDIIDGTADNDTFYADVVQVGGPQVNSLATGDRLDGKAGSDTLEAQVTEGLFMGGGNMPIQPRTTSIEEVKLEALNASIASRDFFDLGANSEVYVNAKNMYGVDAIWSWYSDANLTVQDMNTMTSEGKHDIARNTSELTVGMGYTGNANDAWDASDFNVYFDQDFLLTGQQAQSKAIYYLLDQDADLFDTDVDGDGTVDLLAKINSNGLRFTVDGVEKVISFDKSLLTGGEILNHADFVDALQDSLAALIAAGEVPSDTTLSVDVSLTDFTYLDDGSRSSDIPAIVLETKTDSVLESVGFKWVEELSGEYNVYGRLADEAEVSDEPLSIQVALEKAGRGSDGGELVIGGMSKTGDNEWFGGSGSRGIDVFNVTVYGDEDKPSSLSGLRSTNNSLKEVNIVTDKDQEGTYASLEIGNINVNSDVDLFALKDVKVVDAEGMLGDLSIEAGLTADIVGPLGKYAGNYTGYDYTLGQADNTLDLFIETDAPISMDIESFSGEDTITVDVNAQGQAKHPFSMEIATQGGDDVVTVGYNSQTSSAFLNYIALQNFSVDTGAGDDEIYSNDAFSAIQVDAGSGNDYIEVGNTGTGTASWLFNASDDVTFTGPLGFGNTKLKFFEAKIILTYENITVIQDIDTSADYVTTAREINQAIKDAIDNNWKLSQVLEYEDVRNDGLRVTSTIDRAVQDLNVNFLAPKYDPEIDGGDDWTTGNYEGDSAAVFSQRETVSEADMAKAWAAWYPDSEGIGEGSGVGIYAGANDEEDLFQAMFDNLDYLGTDGTDLTPFLGRDYGNAETIENAGFNTGLITQNVIDAGAGNDVIVLSSNPNGSFDTVKFTGAFGHDVIYNFNTGNAIADMLDFSAYLDAAAATRGASATDAAEARTTHQVGFAFNDWYEAAGDDFDHNQVVHIDLETLWEELAADDKDLPHTLSQLTAAQVQRAMNELFSTDVADETTDEEDMVGSTFVMMVTQNAMIDLQDEGIADLNGLLANPNQTKVFTVVVDDFDEDDDEFSFKVTEQGLIEFGDMFSNLGDLNEASFSFTAEGKANIDAAKQNSGLVDTTPPVLVGTYPGDGDIDVEVDADIVLTYNEEVQAGTGFIRVFNAADNSVIASVPARNAEFDGNTVTVDLAEDLAEGTEYYVRVQAGAIQDIWGNGTTALDEFGFTTAGDPGPQDVVVEATAAWDADGILEYVADADAYRDEDAAVIFELSTEAGGTPLAADISIANFTAGDVLDISGVDDDVRVIDNVTIDGDNLIIDLMTDPGFFGLPVWAITFTDIDAAVVDALDPLDLIGSVEDADWLVI